MVEDDETDSKRIKTRITTKARIDYKIIAAEEIEENGARCLRLELIMDPDRYETIEENGETKFRDKNTGLVFSESVLKAAASQAGTLPIYDTSPKKQAFEYVQERRRNLSQHWDEKLDLPQVNSALVTRLGELLGTEVDIVVLYVDMEGSTSLSATLDSDTYSKIVEIFLNEMSGVIDNYRGYVHKFIGDQAVGVFPADVNFTGMSDSAIQAAIMIRSVVEDVVNPILKSKGLPQIGFHIGLDVGRVRIERLGAKDIAAVDDIIGHTMNLTAKILALSGHNDILLGGQMHRLLHNKWQGFCVKENVSVDWTWSDPIRGGVYEVYRCDGKFMFENPEES
jgi:adenylate cyclase